MAASPQDMSDRFQADVLYLHRLQLIFYAEVNHFNQRLIAMLVVNICPSIDICLMLLLTH